jgi:tetraacyldisaccharide-1-P 4'-kinase
MCYNVVDKYIVADHHRYNIEDINHLYDLHKKYPRAIILMTEKDAVKLANSSAVPYEVRQKLFYEKITMRFVGDSRMELFERIDNDIENRTNELHIRGLR